ncbi:MAG: peptide ABC transporter ATP-binding protein [Deltaproteobacteria bacterium CG11_big_fil_rev_8_21_14_0_20_45_16]|nr:MAG: peptide ABC transporter ATP-binding protein [Deltaproteobacteria bacterium CG11_big_fil_rev_8_21_14_0_20_45_16]
MAILKVSDLVVEFHTDEGIVRAVDRLNFELEAGEVLGIVGESGSGKSVSCLTLMGLLPIPPAKIRSGKILFGDNDLLKYSNAEMRKIRGHEISMIFQDPFTCLNPYLKISTQLMEVMEFHSKKTPAEARRRCLEVLEQLGIPDPELRFNSYPHQLSGGLKQRIMIAMSLLLQPKILIADEPTTALDVTIQAQILDLLKQINKDHGTSIILITHDMGVVAGLCDRVQVMYGGRLAERGSSDDIFYRTRHPYTKGLLYSIPSLTVKPGDRLDPIPGAPPDLTRVGDFCAFADRCDFVQEDCRTHRPPVTQSNEDGSHWFECYHPVEGEKNA